MARIALAAVLAAVAVAAVCVLHTVVIAGLASRSRHAERWPVAWSQWRRCCRMMAVVYGATRCGEAEFGQELNHMLVRHYFETMPMAETNGR